MSYRIAATTTKSLLWNQRLARACVTTNRRCQYSSKSSSTPPPPPPTTSKPVKATNPQPTPPKHNQSSVNNKSNNTDQPKKEDLKWTEREKAPKWLQKMAPTKGGTELPSPKELIVIAVVLAAGYYAWFIDPPAKHPDEIEKEKE